MLVHFTLFFSTESLPISLGIANTVCKKVMMKCGLGVLLLLLQASVLGVLGAESTRYLMISAPRLSKVVWMKLPTDKATRPLIDSGLKSPQGLAVDQVRNKLYVADPDSRKIFMYTLEFSNGVLFTDGKQSVAAQNVEARWVAVDSVGNIFFTDERQNLIQKVGGEMIQKGNPTPVTLYSGQSVAEVSAPGGIAVDNFHIFWTNKAVGTQVGSVVKGYENPPDTNVASSVRAIAKNAMKTYGVCLSQNNVFFTNAQKKLYGVKKMGGAIAEVSDLLQAPRGCVWDRDGTVFVADKTGNAVYSFAGNMHTLQPARLTKLVEFEDSFGLAVISGASKRWSFAMMSLLCTALAAAVLA